MIRSILSVLSGLVLIYAFVPYLKAAIRRQTAPRKVTWLIWALGDTIVLSGQIAQHKVSGLLVGAVIGATLTFFVSLWHGEVGWSKRDAWCLGLAFLAIVLWMYFGESNVGIVLSLIALVIAAWPTWESAYHMPENEDLKSWFIFNASSFLACLAVPHLTIGDAAPAFTFMAIDGIVLYLVWIRPILVRRRQMVRA